MKQTLLIFGCAALLLFAGGCVTTNGTLPTSSANFTPKGTYAISRDKLWQTILDTLDKNHIAAVTADKSSGIIQTDYIAGPEVANIAFVESVHYKYNISLRDQSDGSVKVNIIGKLESTVNSGHGSSQWNDVTPQNVEKVKNLENWLYEQIEDGLKGP
jgi:hypothetical protein